MFNRNALAELETWSAKPNRKPLVLRGARQVGKTTLVELFAERFENFISLNLEKVRERELFEKQMPISELVTALFFIKNKTRGKGKILIFIDEIQNSPKAVAALRYFYEEAPELYVISAGSLLESLIDREISFPVGRVDYLRLLPVTFTEFLDALGETQSLELLKSDVFPEYGHEKLLGLFHRYTLIGGMPEAVQQYAQTKDLTGLNPVYESLMLSYSDDVEKYSRNSTLLHVIRHTIEKSFVYAGQRIKFQHFGNSNYGSRESGEAFRTLEKAMLLQLIYPTTGTELPLHDDLKKSPRLQVLDTGLMNFAAGIQQEVFGAKHLSAVHEGAVAEHISGQELLALSYSPLHKLHFWTRENKDANSEVDFVYSFQNRLIPIEVKAGAQGRLRSLHEFVNRATHPFAVRIYSGNLSVVPTETISGKPMILLNLPYYLINQLPHYLERLIQNK